MFTSVVWDLLSPKLIHTSSWQVFIFSLYYHQALHKDPDFYICISDSSSQKHLLSILKRKLSYRPRNAIYGWKKSIKKECLKIQFWNFLVYFICWKLILCITDIIIQYCIHFHSENLFLWLLRVYTDLMACNQSIIHSVTNIIYK